MHYSVLSLSLILFYARWFVRLRIHWTSRETSIRFLCSCQFWNLNAITCMNNNGSICFFFFASDDGMIYIHGTLSTHIPISLIKMQNKNWKGDPYKTYAWKHWYENRKYCLCAIEPNRYCHSSAWTLLGIQTKCSLFVVADFWQFVRQRKELIFKEMKNLRTCITCCQTVVMMAQCHRGSFVLLSKR